MLALLLISEYYLEQVIFFKKLEFTKLTESIYVLKNQT